MKAGVERVEVSISPDARFAWRGDCPVVLHYETCKNGGGRFTTDVSVGAQEVRALLDSLSYILDRMREAEREA